MMTDIDFLDVELHELIEGQSFEDDENHEHDLFLFETKDKRYIVYQRITDLTNGETMFNVLREFNDVELAKQEYECWKIEKGNKNGK